jgi:hypothetical protein
MTGVKTVWRGRRLLRARPAPGLKMPRNLAPKTVISLAVSMSYDGIDSIHPNLAPGLL